MVPSEFMAASDDDRAIMIGYSRTTARMKAWEIHEQNKGIRKAQKRRK